MSKNSVLEAEDVERKIETCPGILGSVGETLICSLTKSACIKSKGKCIFLHWMNDNK